MARARTRTKLPLDEWFRIMGMEPRHANQCFLPNQELNTICQSALFQYDWQNNEAVSREQLADAIRQAEENIESFLGYHLMPAWDVDEWHATVRPFRPELVNLSQTDVRGLPTSVQADWGYIISGGFEVKGLLHAASVIAWSDADGDGIKETGTVTLAGISSAVLFDEIEIYYPSKSGEDAWQIRPVNVSLVAGTATVTFRRELTLLEGFIEDIGDPRGKDYTVDANFLTTVDIYRRYNDPSTQATLVWEQRDNCSCTSGCANCAYAVQTACLLPRGDLRLSQVVYRAGTWDPATSSFSSDALDLCRQPDAVRLWYRSGWRDNRLANRNTKMDQDLTYIVAIYAASMLDRKVCDCKGISDGILRWQSDLAFDHGATELSKSQNTQYILECPFGTRRGAVEAWRRLSRPGSQKARIGHAVLA